MATDIIMPNLGFDAQEGRLIEWLKEPGDVVKRGDVIAIIESDKANVELESVATGVMIEQCYKAGEAAPVGAVIARLGDGKERAVTAAAPAPVIASPPAPDRIEATPIAKRLAAESDVDLAQIQGSGPRGRIKREDVETFLAAQEEEGAAKAPGILALPKVRKAAREAGVDLAQLEASGPQGTITLADLHAHQQSLIPAAPVVAAPSATESQPPAAPESAPASAPAPAPEAAQEIELSRMRRLIGKRLGESKREAPHFYVTGEFDLEAAMKKLQTLPAPQPRLNDLIQYLTIQTLRRVPALNATYVDGHLYQHRHIDLAIAVAREDGLITPVMPKAERYSMSGLAEESRELVQNARANRLRPEALQDGTFTISNLGIIKQVDQFTAVINPPQVAILAVGTIKPRPVVVDGGLHVHHTVHLTLSGDHRVVDGMHLGQFMAVFQEELTVFSQGRP